MLGANVEGEQARIRHRPTSAPWTEPRRLGQRAGSFRPTAGRASFPTFAATSTTPANGQHPRYGGNIGAIHPAERPTRPDLHV